MKFVATAISIIICLNLNAQTESKSIRQEAVAEIISFRNELNDQFRDTAKSPLHPDSRASFDSLDFYPINLDYRVSAYLERMPATDTIGLKTSTERIAKYFKYGELHFQIGNDSLKLNVYQNCRVMNNPEYADHLFLLFADESNGVSTYGGGRFMDLEIPEGDTLILDFNQCYNPYCAYRDGWSCPRPPDENHLRISIKAGVRDYGQH